MPAAPTVTLRASDIRVYLDQCGRPIVTVPDAVAAAMKAEIKRGWREIPDMNDGESRRFDQDHWLYKATRLIVDQIATGPILTTGLTEREVDDNVRDRRWATHGSFYGFIVGASGFDPVTRWWTEPHDASLSVGAHPTFRRDSRGPYLVYGG